MNVENTRDLELEDVLFFHEHELIGNLRRFPLIARYRLDVLALKLLLDHWQALDYDTRRTFCLAPFGDAAEQTSLRSFLQRKVTASGHAALDIEEPEQIADFKNVSRVPEPLQVALARFGLSLKPEQWAGLSELARFGLAKLSRQGHENRRLGPLIDDVLHRDLSKEPNLQ